ncbi:STELLO glycosyltransferase family protein [Rubellicoccus peritrichatus]|uniref:STELLO glycosyltransferase family protein n=1 Tax=Rubellicoccus peritrichatus TaxID=3080537 RepID=A0AAQ3LIY8_9BACT|nr:STELLO glycosyltransferase family protein [Puniceicoccus sp. CR14]WOO43009.1 STELLO glycosyltransferase family protein [Puniceicoccus sp. CR14]
MSKYVVITSIFEPTEAVRAFAGLNDYKLVVVGDKKTPKDWTCDNVEYLSVLDQSGVGAHLSGVLPYNHYCRKMMGYLYCVNKGASLIVDTDDDNIPKENWSFPAAEGSFSALPEDKGFVNIYELYTDMKIWPRGLPVNLINERFGLEKDLIEKTCKVGIWQGLADEDPDVDAIYRLTNGALCYFNERDPVVLGKGTLCPFNSQNTMIAKELFPLLYLPTYVTFRFTDILRGLVAQPIMWLFDYHLGFTNATVIQKRNPHDYFQDFLSEIPMYKHCEEVIEIANGAISSGKSISDNLFNVYEGLHRKDIVETEELEVLAAWLKDIDLATKS